MEEKESKRLTRKDFLKSIGASSLAIAALFSTDTKETVAEEEVKSKDSVSEALNKLPSNLTKQNELLRMQLDLVRALKKPLKERKWSMALDLRKCIGCSACTVACKAENVLPPGVVYRPVIDEEIGEFPNVSRRFTPRPCMQCENPPCVPVCPVKATYKREDGIVEIDYNKCIGCRYCITACPYNARCSDFGEFYTRGTPSLEKYEKRPNFEYHKKWPRKKGSSPIGNARKCHFCIHRIEKGYLPSCVTSCIGGATYFGDKNDPSSLVCQLICRSNVVQLKKEQGTDPKVFYLL